MPRPQRALAAGLAMLVLAALPAGALDPGETLADPALEERARRLSAEIRCMKCQNQSIDDSEADLARDLRILVRERIEAGDTDRQVLDFLVARYGEFVLLRPRFTPANAVLWLAPLIALAAAVGLSASALRRRRMAGAGRAETKLSGEERAELARILDGRD